MDPISPIIAGIGLATSIIGTGMGVYSAISQAKNAEAQMEYQSDVAKANQELAEQQASAIRKQGYDSMVAKNQETATLIGKQRAAAAASGAALDVGSLADVNQDTAKKGAIDAVNIYNAALDKAYNKDIEAWNYGQQSEAYQASADVQSGIGTVNAISTGLTGIGNAAMSYANWDLKKGKNGNALGNDNVLKTVSVGVDRRVASVRPII